MRRSRLLSSPTQSWARVLNFELYHAFQWKVLANSLPQMVVRPTNRHTWRSLCPLLRPVQLGAYSGRQKSTFFNKKVAVIRKHYLEIHFFQTGVISFYLTGYPLKYILDKYYFEQNSTSPDDLSSWPLWVGFGIILTLSFIFEIVENAQCTIDKYRMGKTNFRIFTAFRPKQRHLTRDNCSNLVLFLFYNQFGLYSKEQQQKANKGNLATIKWFSKA